MMYKLEGNSLSGDLIDSRVQLPSDDAYSVHSTDGCNTLDSTKHLFVEVNKLIGGI